MNTSHLGVEPHYIPRIYEAKDLSSWTNNFLHVSDIHVDTLIESFSHSVTDASGMPHRVGFTAEWGTEVLFTRLSFGTMGTTSYWASFRAPFFTNEQELYLFRKWLKQRL